MLIGDERRTLDEEGLWFEGTDGTSDYVSVKVDRQNVEQPPHVPLMTQQE